MNKKKNRVAGSSLGYCPKFSKFESQYNKLYCDRQGWEAVRRGAPQHGVAGHDTTTARPRYGGQRASEAWLGVSVTIQSFVL